ncbi:CarD family transcriptional regulator [Caproiciproducens faecalis]|uniref:CarD family transcriptional regulator n=1 Tax=Caproiciproducens faecalis TaxID=2820301 RepID=A0ABS7DM64_9FIRM|nr:CarD family transcriptional regulator [Caproiciproducens faecalis]MBW7572392.1 CarD family transcriptional regulator [Caproiciproducens faecalis]
MYQIGEWIVYGNDGVCKVEAVGILDIPGVNKGKVYYTLCPAFRNGKIFTPVDTNVFMRPVITFDKVQELISLVPFIGENVYNNPNKKLLEDHYQEFFQTHDCSDLIKIIKSVYTKKVDAADQGKKLGQMDERFMKRAEDLLFGEFAVVLGIPKESVKSYIVGNLKK